MPSATVGAQSQASSASLVRKIAENYKLPYYTMSPTYSVCSEHGYLPGENYICPHCGKEAEVYSRITGYYRPVKNWNDGKSQEFKDRKTYDIENSVLTHEGPVEETAEAACDCAADAAISDGIYLFTTATCPNCKIATALLDKAGVGYIKLLAEENAELVGEFGIRQAPTLIVVKGDAYDKFVGVSEIKTYIQSK